MQFKSFRISGRIDPVRFLPSAVFEFAASISASAKFAAVAVKVLL